MQYADSMCLFAVIGQILRLPASGSEQHVVNTVLYSVALRDGCLDRGSCVSKKELLVTILTHTHTAVLTNCNFTNVFHAEIHKRGSLHDTCTPRVRMLCVRHWEKLKKVPAPVRFERLSRRQVLQNNSKIYFLRISMISSLKFWCNKVPKIRNQAKPSETKYILFYFVLLCFISLHILLCCNSLSTV